MSASIVLLAFSSKDSIKATPQSSASVANHPIWTSVIIPHKLKWTTLRPVSTTVKLYQMQANVAGEMATAIGGEDRLPNHRALPMMRAWRK